MSVQNGETSTEEKTHTDIPSYSPSSISNTDYTVATVNNPEIILGITDIPEVKIPVSSRSVSGSESVSEPGSDPGPDSGIEGSEGGEGGSKKHLNIKAAIIAADALSLILDGNSLSSPPSPSLPLLLSIITQHQEDAVDCRTP